MDIVQERLEREYDVDLIVTAPSVVYEFEALNGDVTLVHSPAKMPDQDARREVREPYVRVEVLTPAEYVGPVMELAQKRRGQLVEVKYLTPTRSGVVYELPLAEVITDFFDELKSRSKGYASMEYSQIGYRPNPLVRLDIRINGEDAPPLASICHRDEAHDIGKAMCEKLKELIPRQQFKVPIQACIGSKPVASSAISPIRKDVLAKCYGGDISRKKKLLQAQAKGKKRMKAMGTVNVPQEAFMAIINVKRGQDAGGTQ
jgi:GTP-binding protein LepA